MLLLLFPFRIGILYSFTRPPSSFVTRQFNIAFHTTRTLSSFFSEAREIRKRLYRARGYHNWERFVCTSFILRFLPPPPFDSREGERRAMKSVLNYVLSYRYSPTREFVPYSWKSFSSPSLFIQNSNGFFFFIDSKIPREEGDYFRVTYHVDF